MNIISTSTPRNILLVCFVLDKDIYLYQHKAFTSKLTCCIPPLPTILFRIYIKPEQVSGKKITKC